MQLIENYIAGKWNPGEGKETTMVHSIHGQPIAYSRSGGVDFAAILDYGRKTGGPVLRKMTFHERGRMIKALALYLLERKDKYYPISYQTGATKADSWVDIEGGIGNLFPMPVFVDVFLICLIMSMEKLSPVRKTGSLLVITSWCPNKELPFTSMLSISRSGECSKKLRLT